MNISKEGEEFILDLNAYLITTGKSEREIKEFIQEVETHIEEGELEGKTIEDIFGCSPEEYAKEVGKEISYDRKENFQIFFIFLFAIINFTVTGTFVSDVVSYSYLDILFTAFYFTIGIGGIIYLFRKSISKNNKYQSLVIGLFISICIAGYVLIKIMNIKAEPIIFLNKQIQLIIFIVLFALTLYAALKIRSISVLIPYVIINIKVLNNLFNLNINTDIKFSLIIWTIQLAIAISLGFIESKILYSK